MYFMYVDESGDSGLKNSPTRFFTLSGVVMHELRWNEYLDRLIEFRKRMRNSFGLLMREEIHSAHLINKPGDLKRIKRNDRLTIIRAFINELAAMQDISIINIVVDKQGKPDDYPVMQKAWEALIQRKIVQGLLRKMRKYNPVPNQQSFGTGYRNLTVANLVEDPFFKDSRDSYLIQAADVVAFALYQQLQPSTYIKKKSAHNYFNKLNGVLCRAASSSDPQGIVHL